MSTAVPSDELGSYQPLHALAVVSFILGLASILSLAPFWLFLWLLPPAAVLTGVLALMRIAAAPEAWAGKKLAQAGIGLAIFFALASIGRNTLVGQHIRNYGRATSDRFVEKIRAGELESAFWLMFPRDARQELSKRQLEQLPEGMLERYATFRTDADPIVQALGEPDARLTFERVEKVGNDHGAQFALVLYKVHASSGDRNLLVVTTGHFAANSSDENWWVREIQVDYNAGSYQAQQSGGHGHSH